MCGGSAERCICSSARLTECFIRPPTASREENNGVSIGCEADDCYSDAVAVGAFDGKGYDDLAVGIPGEGMMAGGEEQLEEMLTVPDPYPGSEEQ